MVSLFHYLKLSLVKNCDRGLVNAASALRPEAAFSSLRLRFFTLRTDPESFPSAVNWLTNGFAYATLSFNRLTHRLQNRFILNYFLLGAFSLQMGLLTQLCHLIGLRAVYRTDLF